jgi:hypothetical protein
MHFTIREGLLAAALILMGSVWFVDHCGMADRLRISRIGVEVERQRAEAVNRRLLEIQGAQKSPTLSHGAEG